MHGDDLKDSSFSVVIKYSISKSPKYEPAYASAMNHRYKRIILWGPFHRPAAAKSLRSCPTLRPPRRQPTRLPRPWDSPGKNTGVGCHFPLQCMKVKREVAQSCPTLHDPMDCSPPGCSVHGSIQARILERGAIAFSVSQSIPWYLSQTSPQGVQALAPVRCCSGIQEKRAILSSRQQWRERCESLDQPALRARCQPS